MAIGTNPVLVNGAGFTRAFVPSAPLIVDDYDADELEHDFAAFEHACRILKAERARNPPPQINLERLMTRLAGRMPFDPSRGADDELALLLREVNSRFVRRLDAARASGSEDVALGELAKFCVEHRVNYITFNYDDFFDEAVWNTRVVGDSADQSREYWHPDTGYGFYCPSALNSVGVLASGTNQNDLNILKLLGSVNWRMRSGYDSPYPLDAIAHHEEWRWQPEQVEKYEPMLASHIQRDSFIVPPILLKAQLVEEPVLQVVWSEAYRILSECSEVTFVGYSLPVTDIASRTLFEEALAHLSADQFRVVAWAEQDNDRKRQSIRDTYRMSFPDLQDEQFDFRGARVWATEFVAAR